MQTSSFNRIISLCGWGVFFASLFMYTLTVERTVSFWDCGEFIASAYKLQVPHPPGAPLFLLLGRMFSLLARDKESVALSINMVSVIASSFTVMVLFHTTVLLVRKFFRPGQHYPGAQVMSIVAAAATGSLTFAFSDSFWFNAGEAEVYALSCFFTAFVFWAMLKWDSCAGEPGAGKWILLAAYMIGLSIGVHLLSLLTVPAMAFIYYFRSHRITAKGMVLTFLAGMGILLLLMNGIITGLPSVAGSFEVFFVNALNLPFGSGIIFFALLFLGSLIWSIRYSERKGKPLMKLALLSLTYILLGYSTYLLVSIRSGYNPPIDENDPENIMSLVSYLKRDQYGSRPLLKGPVFTAGYPEEVKRKAPRYHKDTVSGRYIIVDYEYEYVYKPGHTTLLPRMYSPDPKHREAYRKWMGLAENRKPTMMQNLGFMFSYQLNHMYWRYFLWNFAGRESSIQGAGWLGPADWFGSFLPEQIRKNTAHNNYYCLPLLLGLLGLYFHVRKDPKGASLAMLLFFFTGIAIVLYLNQPPVEPRERDYTFVGSFYAFSIWIGIGVLYLTDISGRIIRSEWLRGGLAAACGLLVPLTMLAVNLDDHDRRGRYLALDSARNLLAGCEPNSILFTAADNDTFPLWYIQEVEEFRTDVRICNLSLLQSDSYISAMKRRSNLSAPLPISLEFKDFRQSRNDQVVIWENPEYKSGLSLKRFMEMIRAEDERVFYPAGDDRITVLPTKELCLPVDREKVKASCVKDPALQPYITDTMRLSIDKNFLKAELIVLDIIAHNNWERAVYFDHTASMDYPYLKKYFQQEGTFFRLMPLAPPRAENGWVNSAASYRNLIERSVWRGLDNPAINHDPAGMPFISACRIEHYSLAVQLYNEGKAGRALNVLKHSLEKMPDESMPYDYSVLNYPPLLYALGERERAAKVCRIFGERSGQFLEYLSSQNKRNTDDYREHQYILNHVVSILREAGENEPAAGFERILNAHR